MSITAIATLGSALIDKFFPDPHEAAQKKLDLLAMQQKGDFKELDAAVSVIVAEAKSESWLASNWRPITMLVFVSIIANNYLLYPYLSLFWEAAPTLKLPPDMWDLLKIGLGGYVVSRGVEKTVKSWKNTPTQ